MYKKMIVLISVVLVLALAGSAEVASGGIVDYALIDFGNSGTAGTDETQFGIGLGNVSPPYVLNGTSLTGDGYTVTLTSDTNGVDTVDGIEFKPDDRVSGAGAPFTATQKTGHVQRDKTSMELMLAFTDLAPGDYTLDVAASEGMPAVWSATAGASVTNLDGTPDGTASHQAAYTFTVTSETGAQITVAAKETQKDIEQGGVAAITMTYAVADSECPCLGDLDDSGQVSLADLDAMVNILVGAGPPFIVDCPDARCYCADFDESGQVSLADLDAMVNVLVAAGPPFIVPCEPN